MSSQGSSEPEPCYQSCLRCQPLCLPSASRCSLRGKERDKILQGCLGNGGTSLDPGGGGLFCVPQLRWAQLLSEPQPRCSVSGYERGLFLSLGLCSHPSAAGLAPDLPGKLPFAVLPCRAVVRSKCAFWTLQQEEHRDRLTRHSEGSRKGVSPPQHTTRTSQNKPRSVLETWA